MIPIYTDVTAAMRVHLGDTEVAAGQVWTDASGKCDPYIQQAYSELFKGMEGAGVKNIVRTLYGNLPAYTSYLKPATFGAVNFADPVEKPLWERDPSSTVAITGATINTATPGAPFVRITAVGHGFTTGQMVTIFGIVGLSDDVNDVWSVSVASSSTFDLLGCAPSGTYSSGGFASIATQDWSEVISVNYIEQFPQTPGGTLGYYCWINSAFRVPPATVSRQLKLIFYLSALAPTYLNPTATMGFDDCLGFLAYRAAALAVMDRVGSGGKLFKALNQIALGPTEQHSDWGGLYGMLIRPKARSAARNPVVVAPYRNPRRNSGWVCPY